MRVSLITRLEALESRSLAAEGPWLRIAYRRGEAEDRVAQLESEALAAYAAEHGSSPVKVNWIHRVYQGGVERAAHVKLAGSAR